MYPTVYVLTVICGDGTEMTLLQDGGWAQPWRQGKELIHPV